MAAQKIIKQLKDFKKYFLSTHPAPRPPNARSLTFLKAALYRKTLTFPSFPVFANPQYHSLSLKLSSGEVLLLLSDPSSFPCWLLLSLAPPFLSLPSFWNNALLFCLCACSCIPEFSRSSLVPQLLPHLSFPSLPWAFLLPVCSPTAVWAKNPHTGGCNWGNLTAALNASGQATSGSIPLPRCPYYFNCSSDWVWHKHGGTSFLHKSCFSLSQGGSPGSQQGCVTRRADTDPAHVSSRASCLPKVEASKKLSARVFQCSYTPNYLLMTKS